MGNWHVSIKGVGSHGNGMASDVEQIAADFVDKLKAAGHSVESAFVTSGGAVILHDQAGAIDTDAFRREHPIK